MKSLSVTISGGATRENVAEPFLCTFCGRTFGRLTELKNHVKIHRFVVNNYARWDGLAVAPRSSVSADENDFPSHDLPFGGLVNTAHGDTRLSEQHATPPLGPPSLSLPPTPPSTFQSSAIVNKFAHVFRGCSVLSDLPRTPSPVVARAPRETSLLDDARIRELRLLLRSRAAEEKMIVGVLDICRKWPEEGLPTAEALHLAFSATAAESEFVQFQVMNDPPIFGHVRDPACMLGQLLAELWGEISPRIVRFRDLRPPATDADGTPLIESSLEANPRVQELVTFGHQMDPEAFVVPLILWIDDTLGRTGAWGRDVLLDCLAAPLLRSKHEGEPRDLREFKFRIALVDNTRAHPLGGASKKEAKFLYMEARQRTYQFFLHHIAETQNSPMLVKVSGEESLKKARSSFSPVSFLIGNLRR